MRLYGQGMDQSEMNPCRVDCVVYQRVSSWNKNRKQKRIFTEFFKDGKTECADGKVCLSLYLIKVI